MQKKRMRLGLFEVASPQVGGTLSWPHPRSESTRYAELDYWIHIARVLEAGGFDFLFFADGYGYPFTGGDLPDTAIRGGINFPSLDPSLYIPTLARETERLGFVVTSSTGLDHPAQTARRFATLDHLTGGRIGWNIVTGASQDAVAALFGHDAMAQHADRYAAANEYVEVALQLWEGSWSDDAVLADKASATYADPAKLHRVEHSGDYYRSSGYLAAPPSPQRTPLLFQAGTSAPGRELAATNAECVFVQGTMPALTAAAVADIRARATAHGRDAEAIAILVGVTVVVAPTHEEALAKRAEFDALQSDEVVATLYAGNTGIDLLALDPDGDLTQALEGGRVGQMGVSNIERFLPRDGEPGPTVREILDQLRGRGTRGFQVTGSTTEVADALEQLMDATGLDGFLLEQTVSPGDAEDFTALVVPELRARGRVPAEPDAGPTFRERMTGGSRRLAATHRGAAFSR